MGTLTSGRVANPARRLACVEDCERITIAGWLAGERPRGLDAAELMVSQPGFGGTRRWFACPGCGRRCRILYWPPGSARWGCRQCLRLTYRARQTKDSTRTFRAGFAWWAAWPGSLEEGLQVCPDIAVVAIGLTLVREDEKALAKTGRTPEDLASPSS